MNTRKRTPSRTYTHHWLCTEDEGQLWSGSAARRRNFTKGWVRSFQLLEMLEESYRHFRKSISFDQSNQAIFASSRSGTPSMCYSCSAPTTKKAGWLGKDTVWDYRLGLDECRNMIIWNHHAANCHPAGIWPQCSKNAQRTIKLTLHG